MAARSEKAPEQKLEHIVYFEDTNGMTVPIRLMAVPGKNIGYYEALAIAQYRGVERGLSRPSLRPKGEIVVITGQIHFDPPRPHAEGYR